MQELVLQPLHMVHSTFQQPIPDKLQPLVAMPYDEHGNPIEGGPHTYPEMAVAGLWTTASDLALFALGIQDALAGKPRRDISLVQAGTINGQQANQLAEWLATRNELQDPNAKRSV